MRYQRAHLSLFTFIYVCVFTKAVCFDVSFVAQSWRWTRLRGRVFLADCLSNLLNIAKTQCEAFSAEWDAVQKQSFEWISFSFPLIASVNSDFHFDENYRRIKQNAH